MWGWLSGSLDFFPKDFTPTKYEFARNEKINQHAATLRGMIVSKMDKSNGESIYLSVEKYSPNAVLNVQKELQDKGWDVGIKYHDFQGFLYVDMFVGSK